MRMHGHQVFVIAKASSYNRHRTRERGCDLEFQECVHKLEINSSKEAFGRGSVD